MRVGILVAGGPFDGATSVRIVLEDADCDQLSWEVGRHVLSFLHAARKTREETEVVISVHVTYSVPAE